LRISPSASIAWSRESWMLARNKSRCARSRMVSRALALVPTRTVPRPWLMFVALPRAANRSHTCGSITQSV
jgi:hypothetical protein